ncbi:MAG: cytochrome c1 [Geminicoccaceae bacterium]
MQRVLVAALLGLVISAGPARAAGEAVELIERDWPHEGVFGSYDRSALQRGLAVFQNVCQSCHGLDYVAFRNLQALGFSEDQVEAIAASYTVTDGPDDSGEMFDRPAEPSDRWPWVFRNEAEAAMANGGKAPPDLSLMAKARAGGPDYIYSLLVGYEEPPADFNVPVGTYYNAYYPGHAIAMPPVLDDGLLDYADGTEASMSQMAADVSQFLMWTAEPKLETRKETGATVMLFLIIFTALAFTMKRKIWADVH